MAAAVSGDNSTKIRRASFGSGRLSIRPFASIVLSHLSAVVAGTPEAMQTLPMAIRLCARFAV